MILVFGGTTEGKKTAALLDFLGEPYLYSTKTKSILEIKGNHISGDKGVDDISILCKKRNVKLIIDAAHPFAEVLHYNIFHVAKIFNIPVIRYKRSFPDLIHLKNVSTFSSFKEMTDKLKTSKFKNILCLTGVQTISHFNEITSSRKCYFRILDTPHSKEIAKANNIQNKYIIPSNPDSNVDELVSLIKKTNAEIIISKESGESGFFMSKVKASLKTNIPLWVIERPKLPPFSYKVSSDKELLQTWYTIRKRINQYKNNLRQGYTTGTCVTAAAKACFIALAQKKFPEQVNVTIPYGDTAKFLIFPHELTQSKASCVVIKDAGDDPDITHGKEIGCEILFTEKAGVHFKKGKGIGIVTLPGLQVKVGEPAINPVPRKMITSELNELCNYYEIEHGIEVKPFVPEGEEISKNTFNPRVGIVGGISIIGTSGKVIPYSNEAFLSTIKYQVSVAKESGFDEIALTSGKRSENILKPLYGHLPDTAFIHFGNLIGETLRLASEKGIRKITLGVMLGKAIKLAEGHLDTHSKNSAFNPEFAVEIAKTCGYPLEIIEKVKHIKLANAIKDIIPFSQTEPFYLEIAKKCLNQTKTVVKDKVALSFFLFYDNDNIIRIS
ncbi:MAG: cobalt-precorrin-5B (C(1))-methyltransferase [Marinilabiliaceae bacterium]|nr:cobalt-precorrin-5B (C(1))-methyltransferase [Marinilabiliaceae bacterium]